MDLISRQDAIDLVRDVCDAILSECGCHYDSEAEDEVYDDIHEVSTILKCNKAIRKSLMDLPSAQPERKTGRWRRRLVDSGFNADWHCSECGWKTSIEEHGYNFCPHCGADMRGEKDE